MRRNTSFGCIACLVGVLFTPSSNTYAGDFNALRRSLVIVETDTGSGSGFIADMHGKRYVVTNQHVVRATKKIQLRLVDGEQLTPKVLEVAAELDAVRIEFDSKGAEPPPLTLASAPPSIGNNILIYGNSEGMGAVTELSGSILGVGPDVIEVDAGFVRGNSGSPILNRAGQVLGIATFITLKTPDTDWVLKGTRFETTRRFGVRLTESTKWVAAPFDAFYRQTKLLDDTSLYLSGVFALLCCWYEGQGQSEARRNLVAYASSDNESIFAHTQWEKRFKDFVNSYKAYWDAVHMNMNERSMLVQKSRNTLVRDFETMPFEPQTELQQTKWLTPSFAKESARAIEVMGLLQKEAQKMAKDKQRFWGGSILR